MTDEAPTPLAGRTVVTTRERPGALDDALRAAGASVVHVPCIMVDDPVDGGAALRAALDRVDTFDRIVVTSPNGARRVGAALLHSSVAMAAVGTTTAAVLEALAGRAVAVVPETQRADGLVDAIAQRVGSPERILVTQADRAADTVARGLRAAGHEVEVVTAYRTVLRPPTLDERRAATAADAIVFVSGSAARAWTEVPEDADGPGARRPLVCVIGPTTAAAARAAGLKVDLEAADHSVSGVVEVLIDAIGTVA